MVNGITATVVGEPATCAICDSRATASFALACASSRVTVTSRTRISLRTLLVLPTERYDWYASFAAA